MKNYDDIIDLPHYVSKKRSQMPLSDRAAQFASFAALTGYEAVIDETARLVDKKPELSDDEKNILDIKQKIISNTIQALPQITVVYFAADAKKQGGKCVSYTGKVKRIDTVGQRIVFDSGNSIDFCNVLDIQGEIFDKIKGE